MISFNKLGKMGRLGNQMFQIASTMGIARANNKGFVFPDWIYNTFFNKQLNVGFILNHNQLKETSFNYNECKVFGATDLSGYFQSEKYFKHIETEIRNQFDFKNEIVKKCLSLLPNNGRKNIALHIRRGDYVGSSFHYNLSVRYYLNALEKFDNWQDYNLVFFSDDIEFAKWHFSCLPNSYFIHNDEIHDLCAMSLCDHFIIANSSFSWWGAWLNKNTHNKIVIRPKEHFYNDTNIRDLYPENWISVSDYVKLNLIDTEFIIPVKFDHNDRMANINLSIQHIQSDFDTKIHVIEQGSTKFFYTEEFAKYTYVTYRDFHRTKMINLGVKHSKSDFIVNLDADVLLNPVQIWYSVKLLRAKKDIIYPYDGNFKNIPRNIHNALNKNLYYLIGHTFSGPIESWGGAIFCNRQKFIEAGMENEKFISWGPEDAERFVRFNKLGLKVERLKGPIYHLDHYRGQDSGKRNKYIEANRKEWYKIRLMEPDDLKEYIKTWEWTSFI